MTAQRSWQRLKGHPLFLTAIVLLAVLILLRILAPTAIQWYLNKRVLNDIGDYTGHVADVDLALIRGAYGIEDLVIRQKSGNANEPFIQLARADVSLSWRALLDGEISVDAHLLRPQINILDAHSDEQKQTGEGGDWRKTLEEALPLTLNELTIEQGEVTFKNLESEPKVNLRADEISLTLTNLTNVQDKDGERVAKAQASARLFGESPFEAEAQFDPFDYNDFAFAAEARNVYLNHINDFSKVYGNIDFASGNGDVFVEVKAENKELSGYIKPLFENVEVLSWRQDVERQEDSPLEVLWEGAVDLVESLFTNRSTEKLATQVNISGDLNSTEIDSWGAVWSLVKNAFVDALESRFNKLTPLTKE